MQELLPVVQGLLKGGKTALFSLPRYITRTCNIYSHQFTCSLSDDIRGKMYILFAYTTFMCHFFVPGNL